MPGNRDIITAGEWLVSPGERYAPYGQWSCFGCHWAGRIYDSGDEARDAAAEHVRRTGHSVSVTRVGEEILHGVAVR